MPDSGELALLIGCFRLQNSDLHEHNEGAFVAFLVKMALTLWCITLWFKHMRDMCLEYTGIRY